MTVRALADDAPMWLDRYRNKDRARENSRASGRRSYAKNRETINARRRQTRQGGLGARERETATLRGRARRELIAQLKNNPCQDCERRFPSECMDFDHRAGETKIATISQLTTCSLARIRAEIAKCDLICANCHRIRTHRRRSSRRG